MAKDVKHNLEVWECPTCAFTFDARHTNDGTDGEYSCPVCAESQLRARVARLEAQVEKREVTLHALWRIHADDPSRSWTDVAIEMRAIVKAALAEGDQKPSVYNFYESSREACPKCGKEHSLIIEGAADADPD
jgi:Zn finger protein HypA/HybF involved in hydrogenase expression